MCLDLQWSVTAEQMSSKSRRPNGISFWFYGIYSRSLPISRQTKHQNTWTFMIEWQTPLWFGNHVVEVRRVPSNPIQFLYDSGFQSDSKTISYIHMMIFKILSKTDIIGSPGLFLGTQHLPFGNLTYRHSHERQHVQEGKVIGKSSNSMDQLLQEGIIPIFAAEFLCKSHGITLSSIRFHYVYSLVDQHRPWTKILVIFVETNLPTPTTARIYVNVLEGHSFELKAESAKSM